MKMDLWDKTNEYPSSEPVRVGGSTYYKGLKAGYVVHDADGNVVGLMIFTMLGVLMIGQQQI